MRIPMLPSCVLQVVLICGLINTVLWVLLLTGVITVPHASFHEVAELDALDRLELEGLTGTASFE